MMEVNIMNPEQTETHATYTNFCSGSILARGLSHVNVDNHGITILYHLHQCRPYLLRESSCQCW